jgi:HK97 gp10 family phage protein
MKVSMTFSGGQELAKTLNALPGAVSLKVQRDALRLAAEPMRAEAAILAPRGPDAPHIAENIVIGIPSKGLEDVSDEAAVVAVGPEKRYFYGAFWEFGWIHHAAHPFMRPAFDTKAPVSLSILGRELWNAIQKAAARAFSQQSQTTGASRGRSSGGGLL